MQAIWVARGRAVAWAFVATTTLLGVIGLVAAPPSLWHSFLSRVNRDPSQCGLPGLPDPASFSVVDPASIPWRAAPPPELVELQRRYTAGRLVGAYRIRLTEPLFQEAANVERGAELLRGTVLQPGETLSFNGRVGPYTAARGFRDGPEYRAGRVVPSAGGGICKVSSALFNAAVLAALTVLERHPHTMLVSYVPGGQDAAVAYPYKDLRLRNDQAGPVVIWADYRDAAVTVAVYGSHQPPAIEWSHQVLERTPFPQDRRPHRSLPAGEERILLRGLDGMRLRSWLTVLHPDGRREERDLGVTIYRPRPQVVEYGAAASS
ncbi:VanW family protein [Limnochorda pilosa]|uniref:VanW family protein n=1 Tax=Limnochorda pilosa TaxID=1555112 RepID=A0A0K2SQE7_LIMPI|nr:VanW family protein [Limnochorda pilosa]BAS29353.1 VanW family protein [Limnochorda pilosa]